MILQRNTTTGKVRPVSFLDYEYYFNADENVLPVEKDNFIIYKASYLTYIIHRLFWFALE